MKKTLNSSSHSSMLSDLVNDGVQLVQALERAAMAMPSHGGKAANCSRMGC